MPAGRRAQVLIFTRNAILESLMNATLACMARLGYCSFTTYQPGYRFWPFQFTETGIFVALAAVLVAVTFFVVRRRDA